MVRYPHVFVLGLPHSGTTLFGRMLNAHSRVVCVGEMARAGDALRKERPCSCGALLPDCPIWSLRLPILEAAGHYDYRRFTPRVYERVRAGANRDILVDLSKTRAWRMRCAWRAPWRSADAGYVILHRDGRGVLASWLRHGNKPLAERLRRYRKWTKRLLRFGQRYRERTLALRYEDLCRAPEAVLRRGCNFMGIDFEPAMLDPADAEHHFIHSSRSTLLNSAIRLDERWRDDLDAEQRASMEAVMRRIPGAREMYLTK